MRQLSFFQSVQRHLAACPHKTVLLLMRLIKSEASLLVDQSAQLKARKVLKAQIEVLLAYVEGYALHSSQDSFEEVQERGMALLGQEEGRALPLQSLP
jgi:hypothetical protein